MPGLTPLGSIAIIVICSAVALGLILPWLSLLDLKHLYGIESELRKIREALERRERRDDDAAD